ncbi:hypothetical protein GCM10008910_11500 [Faecalicatena orotica]|uniref:Uncharacterized protein n=1 Tax=Faecalicatena orotica TaxID=1544 RepID=A0A2Y9BFL1_9FIRM|nr:hypothetical protein [Faecalicatena orotica]PWJ31197.1 hypothetical protein A8806_10253 [Faecalicatena orotica]SSA54403.1 hypothetical protein SAMN05216536_10253 [Faecalicatena orotica]
MYYELEKDDKYISYLEEHLEKRSKEYSALITYYQEHGLQAEACRVAELGLKRCKEDLTDCSYLPFAGGTENRRPEAV